MSNTFNVATLYVILKSMVVVDDWFICCLFNVLIVLHLIYFIGSRGFELAI